MRYFVYLIIGLVAVAVVAGFFIAGSPKEERLRQFDDQRVADLQSLQWQIVNYWQGKERLPKTLTILEDDISGFKVPHDPETGAEYGYDAQGPFTFSLCATFARPSDGTRGREKYAIPVPAEQAGVISRTSENWSHVSGETCFERTIDKDLYPPKEKRL